MLRVAVGQRCVQGNEIGPGQEVVEFDLFHPEIDGAFRRQEGIVGDDLHLEADGALGGERPDIAATDDAEGLVGHFDAHEAVLFPLAGASGDVCLRDLAGQRHHQGDGVLGGGDGIAEGRVHDDDALGGGRRDVDIVYTDAGAGDHLEIGGGVDDLLGHLGGGADGQTVILADYFGQLVLVLAEIGQVVHLDAIVLEDLDGGGAEFVGYENLGHV